LLLREGALDEKRRVLELWQIRCNRGSKQHYRATHIFRILDSVLTTVNVVSSISILYLSAIDKGLDGHTHFSIAVAGLCTVITSTLQFILDYRTRWKAHERAGKAYGALNREIENALCLNAISDELFAEIRQNNDRASEGAPVVPFLLWNKPKQETEIIDALERDGKNTRAA
jgi:hypothetical protein